MQPSCRKNKLVNRGEDVIVTRTFVFTHPSDKKEEETMLQLISLKRRRKINSKTIDHFAPNNGYLSAYNGERWNLNNPFLTGIKRASYAFPFTAHLGLSMIKFAAHEELGTTRVVQRCTLKCIGLIVILFVVPHP